MALGEGRIIVVDIGKTNAKVSLWSPSGDMLDRQVRANGPTGEVLDTGATAGWVVETLKRYAGEGVETIVPVAHGAAVGGVRRGVPALVSPDYEADLPAGVLADYRAQRDPFAQTGSPALPAGLNLGAQLHALEARDPSVFYDVTLMPYAQNWAWLLTGRAVSEVSSLGCHTDLWDPCAGTFSPLAVRRGWAGSFAPLSRADEAVGPLTADLAAYTGLSHETRVLAGLHDSNAALVAARGFVEIEEHEATVLSTGTWFVAMRLAAEPVDLAALPEARDCLVNVDPWGRPVPSARFMGGREIDRLIESDTRSVDIAGDQHALVEAALMVVAAGAMVLPTFAPGTGPFPRSEGGWVNKPGDGYARRTVACLYAALVADTSLDLIGSKERLLVEGRFSEAEVFVRALASLRPDTEVFVANAHNDVALGAVRLVDPAIRPSGTLRRVEPLAIDLEPYRQEWHRRLAASHRRQPA